LAVVLAVAVKIHGGNVFDGGVRVLAWCTGSGSRESSGLPKTAYLVSPGIRVSFDDRDRRRDDNALVSNMLLIFTGIDVGTSPQVPTINIPSAVKLEAHLMSC
jgi:hypothetical protein